MIKNIKKFNFPSVYSAVSLEEIIFSYRNLNKQMKKMEVIDLLAHLMETEVLKYLPGFPYWSSIYLSTGPLDVAIAVAILCSGIS